MKKSVLFLFILILLICITACIQGKVANNKEPETGISNLNATASTISIEQYWKSMKSGYETSITGFVWKKGDNIKVGSYTGYRYHFSGDEFSGDYIFWETKEKLYICSFTSYPRVCEKNLEILIKSLESFKTLDEIE